MSADLPPDVRQACRLLVEDPASGDPDRRGLTAAGETLLRDRAVPILTGEQRMHAEAAVAKARQSLRAALA